MRKHLDFIVIGAQKCGTTSLFEYLRDHTQLYLPPGKEAPFFSHDTVWAAGWDDYARRVFSQAPADALWGTVTPHYMVGSLYEADPERLAQESEPERLVPERIHESSPQARLVAILRDPVERARSHHRMEVFLGAEHRSFEDAVGALLETAALEQCRRVPTETTSYVTTGEYGRILTPYVRLFGRDQVLVCFSDDLRYRPLPTLRRILEFLGVDSAYVSPKLGTFFREAGSKRRARWLDLYRLQDRLAHNVAVRSAWRCLPPRVRRRVSVGFIETAYRVDLRNRVIDDLPTKTAPRVEAVLREHYAGDRDCLAELVGAEPPW